MTKETKGDTDMRKKSEKNTFLIQKETVVMTCTTGDTLGKIPFVVYSGKGGSLFVSAAYTLEQGAYLCRYSSTRRLCDDSNTLRKMKVEDIERKALMAYLNGDEDEKSDKYEM